MYLRINALLHRFRQIPYFFLDALQQSQTGSVFLLWSVAGARFFDVIRLISALWTAVVATHTAVLVHVNIFTANMNLRKCNGTCRNHSTRLTCYRLLSETRQNGVFRGRVRHGLNQFPITQTLFYRPGQAAVGCKKVLTQRLHSLQCSISFLSPSAGYDLPQTGQQNPLQRC